MKRRFCDTCEAEIEYSNPDVLLDEETVFEGKPVVLRIDLRNVKSENTVNRPDICGQCRNAIVAQVLGLHVVKANDRA